MSSFRIHEYFYLQIIFWYLKMLWVENMRIIRRSRSSCPEWEWLSDSCLNLQRKCVSNAAAWWVRSLLTPASTTSYSERVQSFQGKSQRVWCFSPMSPIFQWAGGGTSTSSWQFTFDFWSKQKEQSHCTIHLLIHSSTYPSVCVMVEAECKGHNFHFFMEDSDCPKKSVPSSSQCNYYNQQGLMLLKSWFYHVLQMKQQNNFSSESKVYIKLIYLIDHWNQWYWNASLLFIFSLNYAHKML